MMGRSLQFRSSSFFKRVDYKKSRPVGVVIHFLMVPWYLPKIELVDQSTALKALAVGQLLPAAGSCWFTLPCPDAG